MKRNVLILSLLSLMVIWGCQTPDSDKYTVGEKEYGVTSGVFHGRWWNYYERGCSYLAGGFYDEAERDLRTALESRSQDSWQARTYGLHFVEYFPNRELGIVLYKKGQLEEAENLLRTSISQVDTERARYYLDLIVKERISRGELQDRQVPTIKAEVLEVDPEITKDKSKAKRQATIIKEANNVLHIECFDDIGLEQVLVNGQPLYFRRGEASAVIEQAIDLKEGKQDFTIVARDLAGKEQEIKLSAQVDLTGPNIGIFKPLDLHVTNENEIEVEGIVVDATGISDISLNNKIIAEVNGEQKKEFHSVVPLAEGENVFIITAKDIAGNETRTALKIFKGEPQSQSALMWRLAQSKGMSRNQIATAEGLNSALITALFNQTDEVVPEINIKTPNPERPSRHNRAVRVAGEVISSAPVQALLINGEPYTQLTGAPKEAFNKRVPLPGELLKTGSGTMKLSVEAQDAQGKKSVKEMDVKVEPVLVESNETKMSLALLAIGGRNPSDSFGSKLRTTLEDVLRKQGRFSILDRLYLQNILTEQQLSTGLADPTRALDMGRIIPSQVFVVGELFARGEQSVEVKLRLLNTETSEVINIFDAFIEDINNDSLVEGKCDVLARQMADYFPRLSGEVVDSRASGQRYEILFNWTEQDGVRPGIYALILYEASPAWVDPDTGEITQPAEYEVLYKSRIVSVTPTSARGQVIIDTSKSSEGVAIEKGLPSITM
ncbi:MAG TPA: CsgG/HfaB family protein [Candidatus Hydrogenedens sp.]|nr:CsgG/HfaB family protein [Candidatus Hydrogenedens sp.]HOL18953.1 CsgG/HfaB family protein [Candidatus Hydrogenedens sp.]HPP58995.1 CsgG/HfaB family protein [Candidatus Hydrogenedens sp.]